jgi:hypothetical protein
LSENNDVTQKGKTDKTMGEISDRLGMGTGKQIQDMAKQQGLMGNMQHQNEQHRQFSNNVECLLNSARQQQMSSEQQIQATLNQASTNLMDSKRLETLYNGSQELLQAAQLGMSNLQLNLIRHKQIIEQMEKECHEQQVATDMQAIQAMQQAISSMAQAQNSMLQSQDISKMYDSITKCQDNLTQIEKMGQQTTKPMQ